LSLVVMESGEVTLGGRPIFRDLGLRIGDGDRLGVMGPNGSGKTTLLRILAGEQALDGGSLQISRGVRIGYLPQDIEVQGGKALLEFVLTSVPGREQQAAKLAEAQAELEAIQRRGDDADADAMMELAGRLADAQERLDHFDRYFSEFQAMRILSGLGFVTADHGRDIRELSGGWKMRAVLAALLFQRPDVLLLDEPTNHLDMPSVTWFSEFLKRYDRAFLLISHDREFLNEQVSRVLSFEPEGVRIAQGNLDQYERWRAEQVQILESRAKNIARERERLQRFVDRFRAQANKAKAVQSRVKALEKMEDPEPLMRRQVMTFSFPPVGRTVHEMMRAEGLRKVFGERVLFPGLDLSLRRGDKIGIIGANGSGKTTLLRLLAGELQADGGRIHVGSGVKLGYYAQHHADTLHPEQTAFEAVAAADPGATETRIRSILGAFLLSGDDVTKKVRVLSGGERARVALARLLADPGHLLLMDEPTNHLDLASSESLAESLAGFGGSLVVVSHNRSLIRRVANTIWNVEDGKVERYPGTLDEYLDSARRRWLEEEREAAREGEAAPVAEAAPVRPRRSREDERARKRQEAERRQRRAKLVAPLERRVGDLERAIEALEAEQAERTAALADPAVYADAAQRDELMVAFGRGQVQLEELTARWEATYAELEEAEAALESEGQLAARDT
jgi:ATP-binding cassette, subfamily F, member 3